LRGTWQHRQELELMAVGVVKVDGSGRHPGKHHGLIGGSARKVTRCHSSRPGNSRVNARCSFHLRRSGSSYLPQSQHGLAWPAVPVEGDLAPGEHARMASAGFCGLRVCIASAAVRCHVPPPPWTRPCWAARTRNRALVTSSKRRMAMLAIVSMIASRGSAPRGQAGTSHGFKAG
jgi:hypothetical protein